VRRVFSYFQFPLILAFGVMTLLVATALSRAQETDPDCAPAKERWEQLVQQLKLKHDDFEATRKISLDRVIRRPLVEAAAGKTVARQVSEAIQTKEEILDAKRKEVLKLLSAENQAYEEYERCGPDRRGGKKKDSLQNVVGKRRTLIQKVQTSIAEVREVEGKETQAYQYEPWRGQPDPYSRGAEIYWQRMNQYWGR